MIRSALKRSMAIVLMALVFSACDKNKNSKIDPYRSTIAGEYQGELSYLIYDSTFFIRDYTVTISDKQAGHYEFSFPEIQTTDSIYHIENLVFELGAETDAYFPSAEIILIGGQSYVATIENYSLAPSSILIGGKDIILRFYARVTTGTKGCILRFSVMASKPK